MCRAFVKVLKIFLDLTAWVFERDDKREVWGRSGEIGAGVGKFVGRDREGLGQE